MNTNGAGVRTFTEADKDAAKRLWALWNARRSGLTMAQKRERGLTVEAAGKLMGISKAAVSQYLRGRIALNKQAIVGFARILDVSPKEIRPDFDYSDSIPGTLKPATVELAAKIQELPDSEEEAIRQFIESIHRRYRPSDPA